jgi:hypothetical protein
LRIYRFSLSAQAISLSLPQAYQEPAMRWPWIDLLFLHGHATQTTLAWRPDAPACLCKTEQVEVDVAELPLPACSESHPASDADCAC